MKIALTGATGFVGRTLVRRLEDAGHDVVRIVRHSTGNAGDIIAGPLERSDPNFLSTSLSGTDAIAHLAALTHVATNAKDAREAFWRVNVEGTRRLLMAATSAKIPRFVYMSSVKVNGEATLPGQRFSGADVPQPEDDYGHTKHEAEQLVRAASIENVVLRPPMVYGAEVAGNFARLVDSVRRGVPLPLGRIDNRRSLISVDNLAAATACALTHPDAGGAVVTLSDGEDYSTATLVRAIGDAIDRPARLLPVPVALLQLAGRLTGRTGVVRRIVGNLQVDNEEACQRLGWTPNDTIHTALPRMLKSYDPATS
ncbi:NAD-dependent epimerase/dehydratase family protein [Sphingomonas sp. Leaf23]|uniref:NAD-dependent epimerase/dehydratase family protein n=1 Tax=Sphingomonas sp. Leaf23 TaxID=1735689 RepID=UPI000AAB66E1|nr:NAD-dependent epimerase/dehydratase family protein [Sphingomonas sp. Leaf23]